MYQFRINCRWYQNSIKFLYGHTNRDRDRFHHSIGLISLPIILYQLTMVLIGIYWNFQSPPPVPVPPPPPAEPRSLSPNNRGSRKQTTVIPPPTKMARLSLGADASRDQAVVLTKDGSSSDSDRSYDNLA